MSELIYALDNLSKKRLGENLHCEYKWTKDFQEVIVQLYFQLVRIENKVEINKIADKYIEIFLSLRYPDEKKMLIKTLLNTRDIIHGKGEKALTFAIVHKLSFIEPKLTKKIITSFVILENKHPLGSWADIKNMWYNYDWSDEFKDFFVELINNQLKEDLKSKGKISLVAKWIPRETNKHRNIFKVLAKNYFSNYFTSANTHLSHEKAQRKAFMNYKKLVTELSRKIDVTQIKQCDKQYSKINFNNVTSITMNKQKNAFLKSIPGDEDRIMCSENFKNFIKQKIDSKNQIKGKRVSIYDLVKQAVNINKSKNINEDIVNIVNSQWKDSENLIQGKLGNFIPMVDTSGSMEEDNCTPLYNAIGLGIRVAEKSILGKRILSFNSQASWINLENTSNLTDMVKLILKEPWGMNTNFMDALEMILTMLVLKDIHPSEVPKLTLCIFSDMQIDCADKNSLTSSFWEIINKKYHDTGVDYFGIPYNTPNILFWNMRSTNGFPVISKQKNVSMLSGFSPVLLNIFCNKGSNELEKLNSYDILFSILNNERYNFIDNLF